MAIDDRLRRSLELLRAKRQNGKADVWRLLKFRVAVVALDGCRLVLVPPETAQGDLRGWGTLNILGSVASEPIPIVVRKSTPGATDEAITIGRFCVLASQ